tara:strand:- start:61 stop:483 length:423 start_codon:yes stop_codon:yes gene_type:complete
MTVLKMTVPGAVVGKARPRVTKHGTYMPKKYVAYLKAVATMTQWAMKGRTPFDRPVVLVVDIYNPRPKRKPKTCPEELWSNNAVPCPTKPDADNGLGSIMDGMEKGGAFTMDSRVHDAHVRTWWCCETGSPRAEIQMSVL